MKKDLDHVPVPTQKEQRSVTEQIFLFSQLPLIKSMQSQHYLQQTCPLKNTNQGSSCWNTDKTDKFDTQTKPS